MKTKSFELAALLNRAAAAIETPGDLNADEKRHVCEDLCAAADALDPVESSQAEQPPLQWGAYTAAGRLCAVFDGEAEAWHYARNRGHMHGGMIRKCSAIAAAPDLLEALKACELAFNALGSDLPAWGMKTWRTTEAAISKAEGSP